MFIHFNLYVFTLEPRHLVLEPICLYIWMCMFILWSLDICYWHLYVYTLEHICLYVGTGMFVHFRMYVYTLVSRYLYTGAWMFICWNLSVYTLEPIC